MSAAPVLARQKPDPETELGAQSVAAAPAQNIDRSRQISLQQAVQIVQSRYPGRVVGAKTTTHDGRLVHEIRVLGADNAVRTVRIDAQSGDQR